MAAGKRQASKDLNHDNWDQEEEPEEQGVFRTAPSDELKNRVIKRARRSLIDKAEGGGDRAPKSVFSGFAGFGKTATTVGNTGAAASPFSFLFNKVSDSKPTMGTDTKIISSNIATMPTFTFSSTPSGSDLKPTQPKVETNSLTSESAKSKDKSEKYCGKLKDLNQTVSDWIKTHVDKNPLCILTPIFNDYEKYLRELEMEDKNTESAAVPPDSSNVKPDNVASCSSTFKFSATSIGSTATTATSKFSFGTTGSPFVVSTTNVNTNKPSIFGGISKPVSSIEESPKSNGFNFGFKSSDKTDSGSTAKEPISSGFSFGKPAAAGEADVKDWPGFNLTTVTKQNFFVQTLPTPPSVAPDAEEDEENKPPKAEFKQVMEKDAIFSKKCKVFVKKEGNFVEKGVGTLYLKPVQDTKKMQMLVRADTNLGNVLVNLILNKGLPIQRMGKNNVMLMCLPTPDVEKPTSLLLRVKSAEEADELFETIEKHK